MKLKASHLFPDGRCIKKSESNLVAVFGGATQARERRLRNVGAGRCDLKIETPYSSSPNKKDWARKRETATEQTRSKFIIAGRAGDSSRGK